jgi:ABC-2 type transport system permease protein
MKQFLNILKFEFVGYMKNKVFIGITLVLVILIGVVLSFPRVTKMMEQDNGPTKTTQKETVLLYDKVSADKNLSLSLFSQAMPDKKIELTDKSNDELKKLVDSEKYASAIVITAPTKYTYIVKNIGMYDSFKSAIDQILLKKYQIETLSTLGVSPTDSTALLSSTVDSELIQTGKNQFENFFYTYVLIFALYMAILLYGQLVATSVASEKSSRAMELLITSAKPTNLMFGKVIGSGLSGFLQLVVILGSSFLFFNLNKKYWDGNDIINSIFNMPLSILLYTILFFILGYFIYSFLYGAVGSLASKVEDVNTSVMPITFLFIIAFMVVIFSMTSGNVDSTLMIVCSYIPLTSPMAMFARIAMGDVSPFEIIISVLILVVSTVGIGYLSAKIYRMGVLLYGKAPKLTNIIQIIKNNK